MMEWFNILMARLRALFRRESVLRDIEEELRVHVEMETETNIERGMPPDKARDAALKSFGNPVRNTELGYDIRGGGWLETLWQDLRYGARMLMKNPGFTLTAAFSLSVGIGVNSTVFGFVNAILFKSISVSNSEGLVYVFAGDRRKPYNSCSYYNYMQYREQNDVFSGLAAYSAPPMLMTTGEQTEEISSEVVTGNYFSVFDVPMQRGRAFTAAHDQLSFTELNAVISDNFWKRRFNSDPDIVGKQLILNGNRFFVIGIASPVFTGTDPTNITDIWVPVTQWATIVPKVVAAPTVGPSPQTTGAAQPNNAATAPQAQDNGRLSRSHNWLQMVGRLKPGVSLEQAQVVMTLIASRLQDSNTAADEQYRITLSSVTAVHPEILHQVIPDGLLVMAVTSLILMICCVNVSSLMLSRAVARQKEFAIRIALGSSRQRLIRQLLTEAMLLSLLGGILGLVFAYWTTRAVLGFIPPGDLDLSAGVALDQRVLWYSLVLSVVTGLLSGLLPALHSFRPNLVQSLGAATMSSRSGRRKINLRRVLVVIQIVASLVLLISTGLFLRSFQEGHSISKNFLSDKILLLNLSPGYGYSVKYNKVFYRQLLARIGATPGVESVTLSNVLPLTMYKDNVWVSVEGRESKYLQRAIVAENYFQTLKIPIVRGREFDASDDDAAHRVVIINEAMARTYWPDENPLGKVIDMAGKPHEVIGVAKDSPYSSFGKSSEPFLYSWLYQRPDEDVSLIVRTSGQPTSMIGTVQRVLKELGGNLPIFDFKTLNDVSNSQLVPVKAAVALLSLLSLIGLIVASIGIYGVTSYAYNQRRREIGIRMSLGAQRTDILRLIMKEGVSLALVGIGIGVLLALGTTHLVSRILYGVSPVDPIVFIVVSAMLAAVAIGASLVPALTAAKSNPAEVLRYE
jgi:putative ABC transport system permease protein